MSEESVSTGVFEKNERENLEDEPQDVEAELENVRTPNVENTSIGAWSLHPGPGLILAYADVACNRHEEARHIVEAWRNLAVKVVFVEGNDYVN